ncbi:MAG: hypothetical protein HYT30_01950 [Parcubacteria group bacterium]|nr:hypothetical protein [Parcubacteria group bacterium]
MNVQWSQNLPNYAVFKEGSEVTCLPRMIAPHLTVSYTADVIDPTTGTSVCGGSIPQGTQVKFAPKKMSYEDIFWFGRGYYHDSPYGDPIVNAEAPSPEEICQPKNLYANNFKVTAALYRDFYGTIAVNPPAVNISGEEALFECDPQQSDGGMLCTARQSGLASTVVEFADTYARPYVSIQMPNSCKAVPWSIVHSYTKAVNLPDDTGRHKCTGKADSRITIPAQQVPCSITVEPPVGAAPTTPILSSLGQCTVGVDHTISMVSTDPDNDRVSYLIDWDDSLDTNGNGNTGDDVDEIVPTGGASSGTVVTATHRYPSAGTKTVRVLARDSHGNVSGSRGSVTFTCSGTVVTPPPPSTIQCADDIDNDGDGDKDLDDTDCTDSSDASEFSASGNTTQNPPGSGISDAILTIETDAFLVRRGSRTTVSWSAINVASCIPVFGSNGDSFPQVAQPDGTSFASPLNGEPTSEITKRTTYTLRCIDLHGQMQEKYAFVSIRPRVNEQRKKIPHCCVDSSAFVAI